MRVLLQRVVYEGVREIVCVNTHLHTYTTYKPTHIHIHTPTQRYSQTHT